MDNLAHNLAGGNILPLFTSSQRSSSGTISQFFPKGRVEFVGLTFRNAGNGEIPRDSPSVDEEQVARDFKDTGKFVNEIIWWRISGIVL